MRTMVVHWKGRSDMSLALIHCQREEDAQEDELERRLEGWRRTPTTLGGKGRLFPTFELKDFEDSGSASSISEERSAG